MSASTAAQAYNGTEFAPEISVLRDVSKSIPEPAEDLHSGKILDAKGDTVKPTMTQAKNPSVIQIPQWVGATFGTLLVFLAFYAVTFYTNTNNQMAAMQKQIDGMSEQKEKERDQKLQQMFDDIYNKGVLDGVKAKEGSKK